MEKVDLVIVGAEGVVENGGIINKVGAARLSADLGADSAVCLSASGPPCEIP